MTFITWVERIIFIWKPQSLIQWHKWLGCCRIWDKSRKRNFEGSFLKKPLSPLSIFTVTQWSNALLVSLFLPWCILFTPCLYCTYYLLICFLVGTLGFKELKPIQCVLRKIKSTCVRGVSGWKFYKGTCPVESKDKNGVWSSFRCSGEMSRTDVLSCLSEAIWLFLWSFESVSSIFFSPYLGIIFYSVCICHRTDMSGTQWAWTSAINSIVNFCSDTLIQKTSFSCGLTGRVWMGGRHWGCRQPKLRQGTVINISK